jgi:hypothetical protein
MLEPELVDHHPQAAIINFILHNVERSLALKDQRGPHSGGQKSSNTPSTCTSIAEACSIKTQSFLP